MLLLAFFNADELLFCLISFLHLYAVLLSFGHCSVGSYVTVSFVLFWHHFVPVLLMFLCQFNTVLMMSFNMKFWCCSFACWFNPWYHTKSSKQIRRRMFPTVLTARFINILRMFYFCRIFGYVWYVDMWDVVAMHKHMLSGRHAALINSLNSFIQQFSTIFHF